MHNLTCAEIRSRLHTDAFDNRDKKWQSAAIDADGYGFRYTCQAHSLLNGNDGNWSPRQFEKHDFEMIGRYWRDGERPCDWEQTKVQRGQFAKNRNIPF